MLCFKIIIKIPQILMEIQEKHNVFKQKKQKSFEV